MVEAGLGREKLIDVTTKNGKLLVQTELIYAGKTLQQVADKPPAELLHKSAAKAFCQGVWRANYLPQAQQRHREQSFARALKQQYTFPPLEQWVENRLIEMGV